MADLPKDLLYKIAISLIPGVGSITAKKLIAYSGSIKAVFEQKKGLLEKIPSIGKNMSYTITKNRDDALRNAEKEIHFIIDKNIKPLFYLDENFPERLKNCEDAPTMIYQYGDCDLNQQKVISIVGTRSASPYGKEQVYKLIEDIKNAGHEVLIVSGLAYGIDSFAHKAAVQHNLPTAAILGHGLNTIYPAAHRTLSRNIIKNGALISEFISSVTPDRPHFVKRNRIIAGLADATIVVESASKGGALITADMANSYNRDVFAFPGKVSEKYSEGCNKLIKTNKAALIESLADLEYILGWDLKTNSLPKQTELFVDLSEEEQQVFDLLKNKGQMPIDSIMINSNLPMSKISPILISLEFSGLVKCLPGKVYETA